MTVHSRIGALVLHTQYGQGVVGQRSTQKCHVLFSGYAAVHASARAGMGHAL
jgi:hypothetical protein